MTENDLQKAIRNRFTDAYTMQGKHYRELVIVHKVGRTIAEFSPEAEPVFQRMRKTGVPWNGNEHQINQAIQEQL